MVPVLRNMQYGAPSEFPMTGRSGSRYCHDLGAKARVAPILNCRCRSVEVHVHGVRQAMGRAGWSVADVDRVEINEAFSAIALVCLRELGFAEDIVNAEGGAIAHGYPIGASGAVLTTRLLHQMQRNGGRRGIVTLCIGGGQGIALALEIL